MDNALSQSGVGHEGNEISYPQAVTHVNYQTEHPVLRRVVHADEQNDCNKSMKLCSIAPLTNHLLESHPAGAVSARTVPFYLDCKVCRDLYPSVDSQTWPSLAHFGDLQKPIQKEVFRSRVYTTVHLKGGS